MPGEIAATPRSAYVIDRRDGRLLRLDAASGRVSDRARIGNGARSPVVDPHVPGRLWVVAPEDDRVYELADDRPGVVGGRPFRALDGPSFAIPAREQVIVVSWRREAREAVLQRVSRRTRRPIGDPIQLPGRGLDAKPTEDGFALLIARPTEASDRPDAVVSFPTPGRRLQQGTQTPIPTAGLPKRALESDLLTPVDLAVGGSTAWVSIVRDSTPGKQSLPGFVVRFDLNTGRRIGNAIQVGRRNYNIALAGGVLWVANEVDRTVTRIDARSGRRIGRPIDVGPILGPIAVAEGTGVVWLARERDLLRIRP